MEATSVQFAEAARALADAARRMGIIAPGFRSPPRLAGAERSVKRRAGGGAMVAIKIRDRPWTAVLGDMIEGVIVTNRLSGVAADHCRTELWRHVDVPAAVRTMPDSSADLRAA